MKMLSEHFSLEELTRTDTGLPNIPGPVEGGNLVYLANEFLEPLRSLWGVPLKINSGYRSPEVNRAVGGASNSAHMRGLAADVVPIGVDLEWAFGRLLDERLIVGGNRLDQAIREPSWIHIGVSVGGARAQALRAVCGVSPGKLSYQRVLYAM